MSETKWVKITLPRFRFLIPADLTRKEYFDQLKFQFSRTQNKWMYLELKPEVRTFVPGGGGERRRRKGFLKRN